MDFEFEEKPEWGKITNIVLESDLEIFRGIIRHMKLRQSDKNYKMRLNLIKRHPSILENAELFKKINKG